MQIENQKVIFPELSYQVIGAAFHVFNELGWGLTEKDYQKALAHECTEAKIRFRREVYIPLEYKSVNIGRYFADFIIEDKLLLEIKVVAQLGYAHAKQVLRYLKNAKIKLGILVYITKEGAKYRRILNSEV